MGKGHMYIVAFSALSALLAVHFSFVPLTVFVLCWIWLLYRKRRIDRVVLVLSFLVASYLSLTFTPPLKPPSITESENDVVLNGYISSAISHTPSRVEFTFAAESPQQTNLLVSYFSEETEEMEPPNSWHRGAKCKISGTVEQPSTSTNPGQFDYRQFLLYQNITHQVTLTDIKNVSCTDRSLVSNIDSFRNALMIKAESELEPQTTGWVHALLFGDKTSLSEDHIELFQKWGLSHLLAISGLHVGLLAAFFYLFLIKGNLMTKEMAGTVMIVMLPLYIVIAGESPSVVRAAMMGMIGLLFAKMYKRLPITDIFSIVFIISLLADPLNFYQLSFQFSFLVTFALLLSRKLFNEADSLVFLSLMISLISQLVILPIQVDQFFFLNPLSPLANLLFVPYFSVFVLPMVLSLLIVVYFAPFLLPVMEPVFLFIHTKYLILLGLFDHLYFPWVIGSISAGIYICYFIVFLLFMARWTAGDKRVSMKYACVLVAVFLSVSLKPYFSLQGTVTVLDVGQGDSIVVELPKRKGIIMIDTGGTISRDYSSVSDKTYEQVLKPFLYSRGISHIDTVFLTHPDLDHIGNYQFIKKDFTVGDVLISAWFMEDADESKVIQNSNMETFHVLKTHHRYLIKGYYFDVLSPGRNIGDSNENSLALLAEFGEKTWLFAGDMEENAEKALIKSYPDLNIDVLKVAHHGSKTSSSKSLLKQITPETAIISVGRKNRFGHPADETIEKLNEQTARIYRTDKDGAIEYHFTNTNGEFTRFLSN